MTPLFSYAIFGITEVYENGLRNEIGSCGKMRKQQTENIMLLVAKINAVNESMHEVEQKRAAIIVTMIGIFAGVNELPMGQIYMFIYQQIKTFPISLIWAD